MQTEFPAGPGPGQGLPGSTEPVFEGVNFGLTEGEFVCIIGHSGCGKTTILNVLAGLEKASAGYVFMDRREVAGPSPDRGVVFQGHALMPWLTVRQNIAFAVRSKWPSGTRRRSICMSSSTSIWSASARHRQKPSQLSGA